MSTAMSGLLEGKRCTMNPMQSSLHELDLSPFVMGIASVFDTQGGLLRRWFAQRDHSVEAATQRDAEALRHDWDAALSWAQSETEAPQNDTPRQR